MTENNGYDTSTAGASMLALDFFAASWSGDEVRHPVKMHFRPSMGKETTLETIGLTEVISGTFGFDCFLNFQWDFVCLTHGKFFFPRSCLVVHDLVSHRE